MSTLSVIINSPERIIWEGVADEVTSENSQGVFDVLPEHANFVTIIEKEPIYIRSNKGTKKFLFETAVLSVHENTVTIYADI